MGNELVTYEYLCEQSKNVSNHMFDVIQDELAELHESKFWRKRSGNDYEKNKDKYPFTKQDRIKCLPECIDGLNLKDTVLIFGLNPAYIPEEKKGDDIEVSSDFIKVDQPMPARKFQYIPIERMDRTCQESKCDSFSEHCYKRRLIETLTYPIYFKRIYELFDAQFHMIWQNENYFKTLEQEYSSAKSIKTCLEKFLTKRNDKFLIFSDLLFLAESQASIIESALMNKSNNRLVDLIVNLFELQVRYYKPSIIVVANAAASRFISTNVLKMKGFEPDCEYEYDGSKVKVFFSSMLSGQRALDVFNYKRLQRDIFKFFTERNNC